MSKRERWTIGKVGEVWKKRRNVGWDAPLILIIQTSPFINNTFLFKNLTPPTDTKVIDKADGGTTDPELKSERIK
jgi:hypothetical protein